MSHLRRVASKFIPLALVALTTTAFAQPAAAPKAGAKPAAAKPNAKGAKGKAVDVKKQLELLASTDTDAAEGAAKALGESTDKAARDGLLDALALGLHPRVAATALRSLAASPDAGVFDTVSFYTHYRDGRVRAAAVVAMAAIDDARAVAAVLDALTDAETEVRAAAAEAVAKRKLKQGVEPLLALLRKGDDAAAPALATLADPDLARAVGELIGVAPDMLVARCLGMILLRPDFGAEAAKLEVVRALGKVPGADAIEQLSSYVAATPEKPPKQSRREAEALIEARLSGDQ